MSRVLPWHWQQSGAGLYCIPIYLFLDFSKFRTGSELCHECFSKSSSLNLDIGEVVAGSISEENPCRDSEQTWKIKMEEDGSNSNSGQDYVNAEEGFSSFDDDQPVDGESKQGDNGDTECLRDSTSCQGQTSHGVTYENLRRRVLKSVGQSNTLANSFESGGSCVEILSRERSPNLIEQVSENAECSNCEEEIQGSGGNGRIGRNKFVVRSEEGGVLLAEQDSVPEGYEPDIDEEDGGRAKEVSTLISSGTRHKRSSSRVFSATIEVRDGTGSSSRGATDRIPVRAEEVEGGVTAGNGVVMAQQSRRNDGDKSAGFEELPNNYLFWMAGLVIQAIEFHLGIMAWIFAFPAWLLRQGYHVVTEPARIISMAKESVKGYLQWMCSPVSQGIVTVRQGPSQVQPCIGKVARKFGRGCFWTSYVWFVLCLLLCVAFILDYIVMLHYVEKPIQMREPLHFDYTKPHPVAVVPLHCCCIIASSEDNSTKYRHEKNAGRRLFPANHKLQVTVTLTLPESDYNRKLGIFQVRTEALSIEGKITATSSYPCMLRFKSMPIRFAETFLMSAPLLIGYTTESQTLNLHMMEFTESTIPTACLRVSLERRAEFPPGAGIPEIYSAELFVNSELPWQKKIIWSWKWTIFIWLGMGFFIMELLVLLCCCRPIILPNAWSKDNVRYEQNGNQNTNSSITQN